MGKVKVKDMTSGSTMKVIISFAMPMFLGMLFQQFYSLIDTMIVGQVLGVLPLAGVGATGSINFMVLGFCNGICNGFAIPVAQMFGAKREEELRKFVANCIWLCIFFSVLITVVVSFYCSRILKIMNTPESIFNYAYSYILIIFIGIPFTIMYNMVAAILRALGDSKTPLVFLAISSVVNILLDILFMIPFKCGVVGAALATVIAQALSGVVCVMYVKKKYTILHIKKEEWKFENKYVRKLCFIGIPMGLQYSITAIGTLVIQTAVNGLGDLYVAGTTGASRLYGFLACPIEALGATMAPFAGQNVGAGKTDRLKKGIMSASLLGFICSGIILIISLTAGRPLSYLFVDKNESEIAKVIEYSCKYLITVSAFSGFLTLVNVVRFTIQGMGYSGFAITAGVLEMIARTLAGILLVPVMGYMGICLASPLAWILADMFLIPAFFICRKRIIKILNPNKSD